MPARDPKKIKRLPPCEGHFGCGDWHQVPANTLHAAWFAVETDEIEFRLRQ